MTDPRDLIKAATPKRPHPNQYTDRLTLDERFWEKVDRSSGGCWEWQGARDPLGYGRIRLTGRQNGTAKAPRVAWQLTFGPIPNGMVVMHSCDNPPCVNPQHLKLGTVADNNADMIAKRRHNPRGFRSITHCPRGHEYSPANTRINTDGTRACRTCQRERWHERKGVQQARAALARLRENQP